MALPLAQSRVLRFVADAGPATTRQVTAALRMDRTFAQNQLRMLTGKGLLAPDMFAVPVCYAVTDDGKEALAAGDGA